ncbi:MAG: FAD-dependent oxidoreductase, partial [SAR324 cluster bacterium]|nr:FAD-dependent oxidoreductase [SAR324 cluster bacterium]
KGARMNGGEIYTETEVTDITHKPNDEWVVNTSKGDITCEVVISCTGNYARQTGRMVGLELPVVPVEHQYIVTGAIPELAEYNKNGNPELAVLRESDASYYMRQEADGLILGPYEKGAPCWALDGVPEGFGQELLAPDVERLEPHVIAAGQRVPLFESAGMKECINGPIAYTPDGNPIVGPAPGLKNFYLSEGHSFGITAAGGSGKFLAEWIIEGHASIDMLGVDPRRYSSTQSTRDFIKAKNEEAYEHVFVIHYDFEERLAARPAKTSKVYDRHKELNASFGQRYGWERPNWFAAKGQKAYNKYSFHTRKTNWFERVGLEVCGTRERAALLDLTPFAKHQISGPGAETYLDSMVANRLPKKKGGITLAHALTPTGGVESEFTITREEEDRFYVVSSGAAERHDHDLLLRNLPDDDSVKLVNKTMDLGTLVICGPESRNLMAKITDADLSSSAFPWLTSQAITVAGVPLLAMRVNFVGELGWELHHPIDRQLELFDAIVEAGADMDLVHLGMYAMESLRLEKSYRMWGMDLTKEYSILEAGLDRFVKIQKGQFTGREALLLQRESGVPQEFVTLEVDVDDADPMGNEPVFSGNEMVGRATSGCFGHSIGKSLALAYVESGIGNIGTELELEILDKRFPTRVIPESPCDPQNEKLRI